MPPIACHICYLRQIYTETHDQETRSRISSQPCVFGFRLLSTLTPLQLFDSELLTSVSALMARMKQVLKITQTLLLLRTSLC